MYTKQIFLKLLLFNFIFIFDCLQIKKQYKVMSNQTVLVSKSFLGDTVTLKLILSLKILFVKDKGSRKKGSYLVARPLRPYPPPLELRGHFFLKVQGLGPLKEIVLSLKSTRYSRLKRGSGVWRRWTLRCEDDRTESQVQLVV